LIYKEDIVKNAFIDDRIANIHVLDFSQQEVSCKKKREGRESNDEIA
jgi:hypothetical protein